MDPKKDAGSQLKMCSTPYFVKNCTLTIQIAQVHNLGRGLEKVPFPEVALQRGFCHVNVKIDFQLQFTEHNVAYKHSQQRLQHPNITDSLTFTRLLIAHT